MIYLTLIYTFADANTVIPKMDIQSQEKCLTISVGFFLVLNGLWNLLVTPNSDLIHKDVESHIQKLSAKKKKLFPIFAFIFFYYFLTPIF